MTQEYDGVVGSVGIARALVDRFDELVRGPSAGARLGAGLAAAVYRDGESPEKELRVGEAQQIYPEIWSNLDAARHALSNLNVDCPEFDRIRKRQKQLVGVLMDSRGREAVYRGFNIEGAKDARDAIRGLESVTPVDWTAIKAADAALADSAMSLGKKNRVVAIVGLLLAAALIVGVVFLVRSLFLSAGSH